MLFQSASAVRRSFRPCLECLEPRLTPAAGTFTEDFSNDTPPGPGFDSAADGFLIRSTSAGGMITITEDSRTAFSLPHYLVLEQSAGVPGGMVFDFPSLVVNEAVAEVSVRAFGVLGTIRFFNLAGAFIEREVNNGISGAWEPFGATNAELLPNGQALGDIVRIEASTVEILYLDDVVATVPSSQQPPPPSLPPRSSLPPPRLMHVFINGTTQEQRSNVRRIELVIEGEIGVFDRGAFRVSNNRRSSTDAGPVRVGFIARLSPGVTHVVLTFHGRNAPGGYLVDGRHTLQVNGDKVHGVNGLNLDVDFDGLPGGLLTFRFHRLRNDLNGNQVLDRNDYHSFLACLGKRRGQSGYRWYQDHNRDGIINVRDGPFEGEFRASL